MNLFLSFCNVFWDVFNTFLCSVMGCAMPSAYSYVSVLSCEISACSYVFMLSCDILPTHSYVSVLICDMLSVHSCICMLNCENSSVNFCVSVLSYLMPTWVIRFHVEFWNQRDKPEFLCWVMRYYQRITASLQPAVMYDHMPVFLYWVVVYHHHIYVCVELCGIKRITIFLYLVVKYR
jgi:hypothetical protein